MSSIVDNPYMKINVIYLHQYVAFAEETYYEHAFQKDRRNCSEAL